MCKAAQRAKQLIPIKLKRNISNIFYGHPAKRILRGIEGSNSISPATASKCDRYAEDVLGSRAFAPWLYVYSAIAGDFKEGWIPDNYYGQVVVPKLKGLYGEASELNALQSAIFHGKGFPDLLYITNGLFLDEHLNVIPHSKVSEILFSNSDRVVFKKDCSMQGRGIQIFDRADDFSFDAKLLGNGVFQEFINQHIALRKFHDKSVATIRMTTVTKDNGTVSLRACYLRVGTGKDSHVQSASHVRIPVDLNIGSLSNVGFDVNWLPVKSHPSSGVRFSGTSIPNFDACVEKVRELHAKVPFVRCIGWDVSVDHEGQPVIMEWNGAHNDIKFSEATQGPCFADLGWEKLWH